MIELSYQPLTSESFAPFGEVISLGQAKQISINQGLTTRFHDLFTIDCNEQGGRPIVSVFRTEPLPLPHHVKFMERHPLGSQAFLPIGQFPFIVLVALPGEELSADKLMLFKTNGCQGINFYKNTWHHFQIGIGQTRDYIVIDRGGDGNNLEERGLDIDVVIPESVITNL